MSYDTPNLLPLLSCIGVAAIFLVVVAAFVVAQRRRSVTRDWAPLVPIVQGTVTTRPTDSTLTGTYQNRSVQATLTRGGAETAGTLTVELGSGLATGDWTVRFGSKSLFAQDAWRVAGADPALGAQLEAAGVLAQMQPWPHDAVVSYDSARRVLAYREEEKPLTPERFRAQLDLLLQLERLAEGLGRR